MFVSLFFSLSLSLQESIQYLRDCPQGNCVLYTNIIFTVSAYGSTQKWILGPSKVKKKIKKITWKRLHVAFPCRQFVPSVCLMYRCMPQPLFPVCGEFLWQCHSTTYRPGIATTTICDVFSVSMWMKHLQKQCRVYHNILKWTN